MNQNTIHGLIWESPKASMSIKGFSELLIVMISQEGFMLVKD